MSERRPIGPVDTMWLNMDRPNNLMVIDTLMWFDEMIDLERLSSLLQRRLVDRYPVFSQRPVASSIPLGTSHWEDDPDFDLSRHVRRATLPAPGDEETLQRYVESRMSVPFDHAHPMWEMILVEGYGSGCALAMRFHHALADGMALAQVMLSLTDASPTADLEELDDVTSPSARDGGLIENAAGMLLDTGEQAVRGGLRALSLLPKLARPSRAVDLLELGWKTGKIADKVLLGHKPETPFSAEPGIDKRAVWSGPRALEDVRRVSRVTGATVNDVLLAAVSGAVHAYLRDHGVDPVDLTTLVPFNVRPVDKPLPRELGNKFALVFLKLPTGVTSPLQRVAEAKRRMDAIKKSPEAQIMFGLTTLMGLTEPHVTNAITNRLSNQSIGVTTNVAGPRTKRFLVGVPIAGMVGWVPGSGQQTLGVCIVSFGGTVRVGFKTDATALPDAEKLVHAFDQDMDQLIRMAAAAD